MERYQLETSVTYSKESDRAGYWMADDYVPRVTIWANNTADALEKYREKVQAGYLAEISDNALKHKKPMFTEHKDGTSEQVGYVITGKTRVDNGRGYVDKYIDLWVTISIIEPANFI